MTAYRRLRRSGGSYFFTLVLADRRASHLTERIEALSSVPMLKHSATAPVLTDTIVILPDHLHHTVERRAAHR